MKTGLLDGKEEIRSFLNGVSDHKLKKFVEAGMPVRIEDTRWYAHIENIENWFKSWTKIRVKNIPE
ncbi:MAG: hypothetical protein ACU83N_10075 [Gammaproteobacteria bacterium]